MRGVRFTAEAKAELLAQTAYYEAERPGLGARFRKAVEAAAARALAFPEHGKPAPRNSRRRWLNDFRFSLVYTVTDFGILIHAVAPDQKMPEYWLQRIPPGPRSDE